MRIAGSGEMHVFLHDFARVPSRPAGSRTTSEMKTYSLKNFKSQAKLPFLILKHCDVAELLIVFD